MAKAFQRRESRPRFCNDSDHGFDDDDLLLLLTANHGTCPTTADKKRSASWACSRVCSSLFLRRNARHLPLRAGRRSRGGNKKARYGIVVRGKNLGASADLDAFVTHASLGRARDTQAHRVPNARRALLRHASAAAQSCCANCDEAVYECHKRCVEQSCAQQCVPTRR
jgi:hypothetical protein